jgi:RNA polymerase sigma factor for flagellar operon FliA
MNDPLQHYRRAAGIDPADTEQLVRDHVHLVRKIAYHLIARLPTTVDVEDLIQSGVVGLLEAAQKYDGSREASFETYAGIRIRGAMIDHVRPNDWTPRSVARRARELAAAMSRVEAREGREARDSEIMAELGIDSDTYYSILRDVSAVRIASLDSLPEDDAGIGVAGDSPEAQTMGEHFHAALVGALEALPERERLLMSLYYAEELNLREIGEVLGVTESRACQLHGRAVLRLRSLLSGWDGQEGGLAAGLGDLVVGAPAGDAS